MAVALGRRHKLSVRARAVDVELKKSHTWGVCVIAGVLAGAFSSGAVMLCAAC